MNSIPAQAKADDHRCWLTLMVLCPGVLMVAAGLTTVSVALPSIALDLRFTESSPVWVVNAYLIFFGGFLILCGRLSDLFGCRRIFLLGIFAFTCASLTGGFAASQQVLVAARCGQGLGAAMVSAVALCYTMNQFTDVSKRAKALSVYIFVSAGGGSLGVLIGGVLTSALSWHWVFLINVPVGAVAFALCLALLPHDRYATRACLDVAGAVTATISIMLAIYAIVNSHHPGWGSARTMTLLVGACALLVLFIRIESKAHTPLMPLELFRLRGFAMMTVVGLLLAAAIAAFTFFSTLHLQLVLQYDPLEIALLLLPANLAIAVMSLVASPRLVARFGTRRPLIFGMLAVAAGLALLGRMPVRASVVLDVLPGMLLLGLGAGMAYNPLYLSALGNVPANNSGVASGIISTAFTMGGAIGLSILASVASARTRRLLEGGADELFALNRGYQMAFWMSAMFAAAAALLSAVFLRRKSTADGRSVQVGLPSSAPGDSEL